MYRPMFFFTPALVAGDWSALGTPYLGGWVGPRTSLDDMEYTKVLTLMGLKVQLFGHQAHSQLLY
jgi:hypothetical protein